jgi:hypothetical protein
MGGMQNETTLERAFALARSGRFASLDDIRRTLKREGYDQVESHLAGPSIGRQLKELCREARASEAAELPSELPPEPEPEPDPVNI